MSKGENRAQTLAFRQYSAAARCSYAPRRPCAAVAMVRATAGQLLEGTGIFLTSFTVRLEQASLVSTDDDLMESRESACGKT